MYIYIYIYMYSSTAVETSEIDMKSEVTFIQTFDNIILDIENKHL